MLNGKKILLGISGGIAAYKSVFLIRLLIKAGAEVKVIATKNALEFITKLSLESISKNKVYYDTFAENNDYSTEHIALTDWADMMIVAPATANIIGKFAGGIADDALSTSFLAFNKQVFIAPAMNCKMYEHYAVKRNIDYLSSNAVQFIEAKSGELACGYDGKGRMEEPEKIIDFVINFYKNNSSLKGINVLITAGPTYEAIDPARFIGNHSSGKMGFALAEHFAYLGANVNLIAGPVSLTVKNADIKRINVRSADEMYQQTLALFKQSDICIMAAAVADFTLKSVSRSKIKKTTEFPVLELIPTKDILKTLGSEKSENQILVGFALETNEEKENALKKLHSKNLDFIVLNSLNDEGAGFGFDTNKISIFDKNGKSSNFNLKSKKEVAKDIADYIIQNLKK